MDTKIDIKEDKVDVSNMTRQWQIFKDRGRTVNPVGALFTTYVSNHYICIHFWLVSASFTPILLSPLPSRMQ